MLATSAEAGTLRLWKFDRNQNQLEFTTATGVQPQAQLLANPTRLVIDLPGVTLGNVPRREEIGGAIRNLRVAQFNQQTTRIVVELAAGYTIDPNQVKFQGSYANQWTVQIPEPQPVSSLVPPSDPTSPPLPAPAPTTTILPVPAPERTQIARVPAEGITLPAPKIDTPLPQVPEGRFVVVIDPGHGGPDPGAIGIGGLREVDVIMPISFQVAALLRQQGVRVVMTREEDRDLGLEPRVQIARRANATLFVSIHANAISMERPDVNGIETYFHSAAGQRLAEIIHRNMLAATGSRDRRVRKARFYVLRRTTMPSVLLEVGFVTGAEDASRLREPEHLNNLSVGIARGILEYLQTSK